MRISDWSSDVCSSGRLVTTPGRQRLKVGAQASRAGYGRFDFLDHTGWDATMGWALVIGPRLTGTLEGSPTRRLESSEERRGGKECVGTCRSRGVSNLKKQQGGLSVELSSVKET